MEKIFILVVVVALASCATPKWYRFGSNQEDFDRDNYECERDTRQSGYYGGGFFGMANMQGFYQRCMVARGYELRSSGVE